MSSLNFNIKATGLIWTDCTFPTFIWSILSLFKFEKKNARQLNKLDKFENAQKLLLMFCEIKDFKISYRYCIIDLEQMVRHWCRSGTTRQNRFHEFSESFQIGLIPFVKSVKKSARKLFGLDRTPPNTPRFPLFPSRIMIPKVMMHWLLNS